ncbi:MAG: hypothetical protein M3Q86_00720 [Verrucomicrobiota bacterium]|nr:hypothetical protein [Verrucomicrobiota bacterium]
MQEGHALVALLRVVTEENAQRSAPRPLLLKIAPALSNEALAEIIGVCEEFGLAGMIATNTTLDHGALRGADETGGLSGSPLRARATEVVRFLRGRTRLPLIGVGGICDAASSREKLEAGAELLQIYTGYIYRGPRLLANERGPVVIRQETARAASVAQIVGLAPREASPGNDGTEDWARLRHNHCYNYRNN